MNQDNVPAPVPPSAAGEPPASPVIPSFRPPDDTLLHRALFNQQEIRSGWRLLIFALLWTAIFFVAASLTHGFTPYSGRQVTVAEVLRAEGLMFFAALVSAAILGLVEKRSFANYALPWSHAFRGEFWRGVLWGGIALTALLALIRLGGGFSFGPLSAAGRLRLLEDAGLWAAASLLIGFYEEFFFRGYTLFTLTTGIGFWPSAIVLSIVFGAVHLGNHGEDWPGVLAVMLIGLFFCFTVRRTGTLWFAIGLHAMWDYGENFIFAVPDSGVVTGRHLFSSTLHGPGWLTGGSAGPEGSLLVFIVIGVLFLLLHLIYPDARFGVKAAHKPQPHVAEGVTGAGKA